MQLELFQQDIPVREKVLLVSEEAQKTKDGYGQKYSESLENSDPLGLLEKMLLDTVLSDLEEENYSTRTFVFLAVSVGAPHQRYRTFIIGHSNDKSKLQADSRVVPFRSKQEARKNTTRINRGTLSRIYWEEDQPTVCGMDDGTATRLDEDRLRFLGNAVVPQQIYPIFEAIAKIEGLI